MKTQNHAEMHMNTTTLATTSSVEKCKPTLTHAQQTR